MRLGVAGMLPGEPEAVTVERLRALRALGLAGASWHMASVEVAPAALRRVATAFAAAEIALAQLAPPAYPSLADPDPLRRATAIDRLRRMIEHAHLLEAPSLYVRPGSLHPRGGWTPHPDHHRPETIARLTESLRRLAEDAAAAGVTLAVEGHVVSPLPTPEVVRAVLDTVASPALRFNMDPVNFVGTLDDAFDPTPLLDRLFRELGPYSVAAHLKDVTVEERLVVHIAETLPGRGRLPLGDFLRRWEAIAPDGWCLLEHLSFADLPEAIAAVRAARENPP